MRSLLLVCLAVLLIDRPAICAEASAGATLQPIHLADPTIFVHDGVYYLYGTNDEDPSQGIPVYTSTDLKTWVGPTGRGSGGNALAKGEAFGTDGFWAPQVFEHASKFFIAYTANEQIAIAQSSSPLGPFINAARREIDPSEKQIDPFVYRAADGKPHLFHVRFDQGNNIYVAEMTDDLTTVQRETLVPCIVARAPWENAENAAWPVAEGACVIKHKDVYYLIYSANDFRSPEYAVGFAASSRLNGPWEKSSRNPILSRKDVGENGTGHGELFCDRQGAMWYVFHTHHSKAKPTPRRTALVRINFVEDQATGVDYLAIDRESFRFLNIAR